MPSYKLQEAVFNKLQGLSAPVYDHVPQKSAYPYIVIGEDTISEWDTDDKTGFDATVTIHVWSRYRGKKEAKLIQSEIYAAMNRQNLDIADYGTAGVTFQYQDVFMDSDGLTYHGVCRYQVLFAEPNEFELGVC